jgi:hypothetical protein
MGKRSGSVRLHITLKKVDREFDEDLHPRDEGGKFAAAGGGGESSTGRTAGSGEVEYHGLIAQARSEEDAARAAGDTEQAAGIAMYRNTLEGELGKEASVNTALWDKAHVSPEDATQEDWDRVAAELDAEGYAGLSKYTKDGIAFSVEARRGAQDAGYQGVGGKMVMVRKGAYSVAEGKRIAATEWAAAQDELSNAMGKALQDAGYSQKELSSCRYAQLQDLCRETGQMKIKGWRSQGRPLSIDEVPYRARIRVMRDLSPDKAATAGMGAEDPLNLPTFGVYQKFELAATIRSLHGK